MSTSLNIINLPNTEGYTFALDNTNNLYYAEKNSINYLSGSTVSEFKKVSKNIEVVSELPISEQLISDSIYIVSAFVNNQLQTSTYIVDEHKNIFNLASTAGSIKEIQFIQEITSSAIANTLYITPDGDVQYYVNADAGFVNLSFDVIDNLHQDIIENDVIPDAKAVKTYINDKLADKVNLDIVDSIPDTGTHNTIYVTEEGEVKYFADETSGYIDLSYEIIGDLINDIDTNIIQVPNAVAVKDYITNELKNNKSEVEVVSDFPESGNIDTIYINSGNNEAKYFENNEWKLLSIKAVTQIVGLGNDETVPTTKAVSDYINDKIENIDFPEVFYITSFEGYSADVSGLYIDENGQSRFWSGTEWQNTSHEVIDEITEPDANKIPSVKAVYDYVNGNKQIDQTNTEIVLTPESNTIYEYTQLITNFQLTIDSNLYNSIIKFTTGSNIVYTVDILDTYKINSQFGFSPNTSYIIIIDDGLIVWSKVIDC